MFASILSVGLLASSALAATIDVTVGGTSGELVFNPEAIVGLVYPVLRKFAEVMSFTVCSTWRSSSLPLQPQKPHSNPVVVCEPLWTHGRRC